VSAGKVQDVVVWSGTGPLRRRLGHPAFVLP
jgi:hypothetical protein